MCRHVRARDVPHAAEFLKAVDIACRLRPVASRHHLVTGAEIHPVVEHLVLVANFINVLVYTVHGNKCESRQAERVLDLVECNYCLMEPVL